MMKYVLSFVLGILAGIGIHWYLTQPQGQATARNAGESIRETASHAGEKLKDTFDSDAIKDELARTGKVIREKSRQAGEAIEDAATNARITAAIKAKLIKESSLAAFKIAVDTTDGVVTLSGTVSSYDEISRAMSLALETEGVRKVVSTLQVKSN